MKKSLVFRIRKKIGLYKIWLACKYDAYLINRKLRSPRKSKRIYLFGSPNQVNLGDQAQTYCIEKWFKKNFPMHEVFIFTYYTITSGNLNVIRRTIEKDDKIFIHSGYHITDLYNLVDKYCEVIKLFPDYKIVVFPQTVNFVKNKIKEKYVADIFNAHPNLTLMCRDEISFKKAQPLFNKCKLLLYPDIVTSLIGVKKYFNKRNGILFCMRNDKEALYDKASIEKLRADLNPIPTAMTDTDSPLFYRTIQKHRGEILQKKWNDFSCYRLVITDRYHGTIFSLIANTPVIVLSSTDHKLESGVKWFPPEFGDFVAYAENLDIAYSLAVKMYNRNENLSALPPYFEEHYYSSLFEKL